MDIAPTNRTAGEINQDIFRYARRNIGRPLKINRIIRTFKVFEPFALNI